MTVCAIILAVLLITVIPLIFWIKGYKSQEGWFVGTGVAISMAGVLLSLFIFSHIWPGYLFNKFCFLFLLAFLGNGPVIAYYHYKENFGSEAWQIFFVIFLVGVVVTGVSWSITDMIERDKKIETATYTEIVPETIELISLNSGMSGVEGNMSVVDNMFAVVGSGYVNSEPVYFYYHRNENGGIIRSYVPSDSNTSQIFDVLEPNEQAYLQIINTIEMETDNNFSPAKVTKKVIKTQYEFYVPKNTVPVEFELNLN